MRDNRLLFSGRWIGVLAFLLLAFCSAFPQGGSQGGVTGVVKDPSGAALAGATVTLKNPATGDTKTTTTGSEGSYAFTLINNGKYVVTVEKEGFATATYTDVVVLPAQTRSLNPTMKVGAKSETVEVVAGQEIVNTVSVEIAGSVTQTQMLNLPLNGRNPIELLRNQAGVPGILAANREQTGINGGRPGWTQITQDGINVQDNFIRNNAADFIPSRPTSDTIGEFSVIATNVGADSLGGASQVRLITPSGTNQFHGSLYEFNRNNALGAYNFFSKRVSPLPKKPFLNQNQFGAKLGGPILRNKLFFWGSYEGFRLRQQVLQKLTVPVNADYLTGTYRYVPTGASTTSAVNVVNLINANLAALRAAGKPAPPDLTINPLINTRYLSQYKTNGNSIACGDSTAAILRNTNCNSFNQGNPTDRNQWSFRGDYNLNSKHTLQFNYQRFADKATRTDIDNINAVPTSTLSTTNLLYSGAWRWTITSRLLNEFRAGDYSSVVPFLRGSALPDFFLAPAANNAPLLTGLALTAPQTQFADQGRNVGARQYMDNASYMTGNHDLQFGVQYEHVAPHPYNFAGVIPTVTLGFTGASSFGPYLLQTTACSATVTTNCNPAGAGGTAAGATQTQVTAMNNYAAFLAGAVAQQTQTFQAKDTSSGFVPGQPNIRRFDYSITNYYVQDHWRVRPNLTLTLGLKYEYWTPISVEGSLALEPVITGDLKTALLDPNGKVAPVSQLWKPDRNQFGPSVGFAWAHGKTVLRGGYSLAFVNEDSVTAAQNAINSNFGLVGTVTQTGLSSILTGAPTIPVPAFAPNRTFANQLTDSGPTAAAFAMDPHLRTPSVHELSLGVQREIGWNSAIEARYVGTFSRDLWRGVDYNQQNAASNPDFFGDFLRARANLFNCNAIVAPTSCAAGQALTFIPTLDSGRPAGVASSLTNATVVAAVKSGQIGAMADFYVNTTANRNNFPNALKAILPNPGIYGADAIINGGRLNYNSLQVEFRRRAVNGLSFQANYTFSKDLSDTQGDSQNRFEPLLDNARPDLNYSRSPFDINHAINVNYVYELPIGRGKRFLGNSRNIVDKILGGWSTSSLVKFQSGSPFSFISGNQTYQRRATDVMAYSSLSVSQIKKLLGVRSVNGITYFIDPKVLNTNGTAVGADTIGYTPTFAGQVFFNPQPGEFGSFKKLEFSGPWTVSWDTSIKKVVKFGEAHPVKVTYAADLFNVTNSIFYFAGDPNTATGRDYNINSASFGQLGQRGLANRVVQMSLRVDF
jgi:Carboxypeptidase regulatory-like domain/TonB dependent receptor